MTARTTNVSAHMDLGNVKIQILDYVWRANEQITECQDWFILRYRPSPSPVSIAANMRCGGLQDFGQLMFFPAKTVCETTPAKQTERSHSIVCSFRDDWFRHIWPDREEWSDTDLACCYDLRNVRLEQAIQRLGMEAASPGFASDLMAESLAQVIAVDLARHFTPGTRAKRVRTRAGRFSARELGRIYDYVDSISNRSPDTEEIASLCGISPAHLRRSFKISTGDTLHQYVSNARLRKAKGLLAESDLPLKEVAFRLGFASASTFSSTFSKIAGETPSGYRQRVLEM